MRSIVPISAFIVIVIFSLTCGGLHVETQYDTGMVASSSPIASEIGCQVLKDGGNAFDAAIAVGFALAVCHPQAGNIGGGGFALMYTADDGTVTALDFRETAPGDASADMYLDADGKVIKDASLLGARAAGVPGTVAGLYELWRQHGTRDWYDLLKPAINLADTGLIISDHLAEMLNAYKKDLAVFSETRAVFLPDGTPPNAGARLLQSDLALTLERIGLDSIDGFYSGHTSDLIVMAMKTHGGSITHDDLLQYAPVWRQPITFTFDSFTVYSMPPPSSGGVMIGEILKLLEPYDFYSYAPDNPEYMHLFVEACRLAYADRAVHLGDPAFVDNPIAMLLDSTYIDSRRKLIDRDRAGVSSEIGSGLPNRYYESESTTHFCVADSAGNVISLTYTINTAFGSKLVVDGGGFLLNNEMDDFAVKPGVANAYGLTGGTANAIAPGKRMLSSMSPTIVMKNDHPVLALGSPGGSKIITTVAQAIINFSRFDLRIGEIVARPRFHHQWMPDTLYLEQGEYDISVIQNLIGRGHLVKERDKYSDLQMIRITDEQLLVGASDPRGGGAVKAY